VKHLLYNAADVRHELYGVWNELREQQNEHIHSWSQTPEGHDNPCQICARYDQKRRGIIMAIRHFGGRPRR
jgi:hypothetical protein